MTGLTPAFEQALVRSVIDVQKAEEGALMGQFVEVLNSKKDEIERLRQEILRLNEKLEAERVGLGRVPSLVPTPAAARLRAGSDDSALDSDLRDSSDDERSVLPPNPGNAPFVAFLCARFTSVIFAVLVAAVATLPLASLESAYQPVLRAAHAPPRGMDAHSTVMLGWALVCMIEFMPRPNHCGGASAACACTN